MKLSFSSFGYSSFPTWLPAYPIENVIERLARIGYDGIEIGAASPHAFPEYTGPERRKEIRRALEANGIALSSMLPAPGGGAGYNAASPLPEERENTVRQYSDVVELCADLGGPTVLYVAGWQVYGTSRLQAWDWSKQALERIAARAADLGITIVIEPTAFDSNLIESCDDALEMMQQVAMPNVKVMFDTFHVLYRSEVMADYAYRMGSDLRHIHLSGPDRQAPGDGRGDFVGLIEALKTVQYDGYLTMEIAFHRRDIEVDAVARQAYQYIKGLVTATSRLESAGVR